MNLTHAVKKRRLWCIGLFCMALNACGGTKENPSSDRTAPTIQIKPDQGATVFVTQVPFEVTYSDADSGIDVGTFSATLDGQDIAAAFTVEDGRATGTSSALATGSHTLSVSIKDKSGNTATQASTFTVGTDGSPPSLSLMSPAGQICVGASTQIVVSTEDQGSGIDSSSFRVKIGGVEIATSFTLNGSRATAVLGAVPSSVKEGANTLALSLSDNAQNEATTSVDIIVDRSGPTLALGPEDPVPAEQPVVFVANYSDSGCAGGIDMASFRAALNGNDITPRFAVGSDSASASLDQFEGTHQYAVTLRDVLGNETQSTLAVRVYSPATGLELTLTPDGTSIPLGVVQTLAVRAVSASGMTAFGFQGSVFLTSSDANESIDGQTVDFDATHAGQRMLPVQFLRTGQVLIAAESLEAAPMDFSTRLEATVVQENPVISPALPGQTGEEGDLEVTGYSFLGADVDIVVDNNVLATVNAGASGRFVARVKLGTGSHTIFARARHPSSNDERSSDAFTVEVPAGTPVGLKIVPSEIRLALGQSLKIQVVRELSDGTEEVVTSTASLSLTNQVLAIDPGGTVTADKVGSDTLVASLDGLMAEVGVEVSEPVLEFSSPANGESDVAVTRETVLQFSAPLDPTTIHAQSIFAEFAGTTLATTLRLSADQKRVTLFYDDSLPSSARIRINLNGDIIRALGDAAIDLDRSGTTGGLATIDFDTLSLTVVPGTAVFGRVFASEIMQTTGGSMNVPLEGVRITVDGMEDTLFAVTDSMGNFRLDPSPAGRFFVHIDGKAATGSVPQGAYYPSVGKAWEATPAEETGVGNVHLPLIRSGTLQTLDNTLDTNISFAASVLDDFPELEGAQITVPAGAVTDPNCQNGGSVGIAPVDPERLPGDLPDGLSFSLVITVQSDCATNFNAPVPVCLPNTDGLEPGAETALWSFDHDAGRWSVQGSMTITEDGRLACTDPGVGIQAPGWHGTNSRNRGDGGKGERGDPRDPTRGRSTGDQECSRDDCPCDGECSTQNSVLLHSGEEKLDRVDLTIPGRGDLNFTMRRRYRSQYEFDGPLGHGWDFDYNDVLFPEPNGDVTRCNGRSHIDRWAKNGTGFDAPEGHFRELVAEDDGSFTLRAADGLKRFYGPDGRLHAYVDRYNNVMLFHYDARGNLDIVVDPYGREIDFQFEQFSDGKDRLVRIVDFIGREVEYRYDTNFDLVEVRRPITLNTPHGNDFPEGRTERYTYSSGFGESALNHNILSVTAPEDVARSGPPRLAWTYGEDPNDPLTFDKVLTETDGGTNHSGVAAGGTLRFGYELLNQSVAPGDLDVPRGKASVRDRNGNLKEYFVNEKQHHILTRKHTRGLRGGEPQFFETQSFYNEEGLLLRRRYPEGNEVLYTYDTGGRRLQQSNVLEMRMTPGPRGGGEDIVTTYTYEPLYNQYASVTGPRGNASAFTPPIGAAGRERYTTLFFYDYQEGTDAIPDVQKFGLDISGVPRGLGDLNHDGRTNQTAGKVVRNQSASVLLVAGSNEATRIGGTTQEIVKEFQWNDRGQKLATIDPEGNISRYEYYPGDDPDGDGLLTFSPFIALDGGQTGYLKSLIVDADTTPRRRGSTPPTALRSVFTYDPAGRMLSFQNPRGVVTQHEYNAYDEIISITRGADVTEAVASGQLMGDNAPRAYKTLNYYDHNGRTTRVEVENRDSNTPGVGAFVETTIAYDILDNPVMESVETDGEAEVTTQYAYDANENRVRVQYPEGNGDEWLYDERDLLFQSTRGAGSSGEAIATVDYDLNGNRTRVTDAEDNDGNGQPESIQMVYDGFDRIVTSIDRMGNERRYSYDVASNVIGLQTFGHPPNQPEAPLVLLEDISYTRDEQNRIFLENQRLFVADGFSPARTPSLRDADSDGVVTKTYEYDALSRRIFVVDDDGATESLNYDGANRLVELVDATRNVRSIEYDGNGNPVRTVATEVSVDGVVPPQTFTTYYVWDQLDRPLRVTDNVGHTTGFEYDSRDNLVRRWDPQGQAAADPLGVFASNINAPGNLTTRTYDGLDRVLMEVTDLRQDGSGAGALDLSNPANADGQIRVQYQYDENSRLTGIMDDKGNLTRYEYDDLNRRVRQIYADGKGYTYVYDRDHNRVSTVDPNGTTINHQYDALNRLTTATAQLAASVEGTTLTTYGYDGMSRLVRATEDNGALGATREVTRIYDSLSRIIEEQQDGAPCSSVFLGDGERVSTTYPGGRAVSSSYDALNRMITQGDQVGQIQSTDWIGPHHRILRRNFQNGTTLTYLDDAGTNATGYDGINRPVRQRHVRAGSAFVDREYTYNRANHRLSELRHDDNGLADLYGYDSAYRLTTVHFDQNGNGGTLRNKNDSVFSYDGVGNRVVKTDNLRSGESNQQRFETSPLNQYTSIQSQARSHDGNGNLVQDGRNAYVYDYKNRLVRVNRASDNTAVARYEYDALDRRVLKTVFKADDPNVVERVTRFLYDNHHAVEERNAADEVETTYVYGRGTDTLIHMERSSVHPLGASRLHFHSNTRGDIVAMTDETGAVVERNRYDAFGAPEHTSTAGNPYLFQGRRYDEETGLYYYRNRYYDPENGRFVQRDPMWDPVNAQNVYSFVGNGPLSRSDPMGTNTRERPQPPPEGGANVNWLDAAGNGSNVFWGAMGQHTDEALRVANNRLYLSRVWANGSAARSTASLSGNFQNQIAAARNSRLAGAGGHVANVAFAAVGEAGTSMNTSYTGAGFRVGGVAASQGLLNSTPQGTIVTMVSGIVDNVHDLGRTYEWWGGDRPPKVVEVFNNAGRSLGVLADVASAALSDDTDCRGRPKRSGWRAVENFVNHAKNEQGSVSRAIVEAGEWWGEPLGDLWNWASGETARAERLEQQRQALMRRRGR